MSSVLFGDRRRLLLSEVALGSLGLSKHVGLMLWLIITCGGVYGLVLGLWHGPKLSLYVAAKIPILLISTAVVTSLFNFVGSSLLGLGLRYRQVFAMTLLPLAIAAAEASKAPLSSVAVLSRTSPGSMMKTSVWPKSPNRGSCGDKDSTIGEKSG